MVDYNKLDETIQYGLDHPDKFDMAQWIAQVPSCGTVGCLAGTACLMAGYVPAGFGSQVWNDDDTEAYTSWAYVTVPDQGSYLETSEVAKKLLDITSAEAGLLFYESDLFHVINVRNQLAQRDKVEENWFGLETVEVSEGVYVVEGTEDEDR